MGISISREFSNTTYPWPVVVYSYCCRSVMSFWGQKDQKPRHTEKFAMRVLAALAVKIQTSLVFARLHNTSQAPFARAAWANIRSGTCLPLMASACFAGCCGPWFARLCKIIYTRANLQTYLAQWPANKRPWAGFLTVPVYFGITSAGGNAPLCLIEKNTPSPRLEVTPKSWTD